MTILGGDTLRDTSYVKNYKMANKGKLFEEEIIKLNEGYKNRGVWLILIWI